LRTRVWTAGRVLVLGAALAATYGVFFLASLRVATLAREVRVPDVRGKSVPEATSILAQAGLVVRLDPTRRADPAVPADHVLSQEPEPGSRTRRQRAVRIRVSDGAQAFVVPLVVGQSERAAEMELAQAGIQIASRAEIREPEGDIAGTVLAQDPPGNDRGASVALLVRRNEVGGPTFVMPDLIGTLAVRSASVLRGLGFRVAVTAELPYPGLPPGVVIRQTPQGGFQIGPGQAISLEVSR
jgi:serine/threonine-protein kinase